MWGIKAEIFITALTNLNDKIIKSNFYHKLRIFKLDFNVFSSFFFTFHTIIEFQIFKENDNEAKDPESQSTARTLNSIAGEWRHFATQPERWCQLDWPVLCWEMW